MKNDQDQMAEETGAVPKTSYAGGKFDPQKNVRGGDRYIRMYSNTGCRVF